MPSFKPLARLAAVAILGGLLFAAGTSGGHAQQQNVASTPEPTPRPSALTPEAMARMNLRSETRIRRLHDRLVITADEEPLWGALAQVMRDNASAFRDDMGAKTTDLKASTALNDLKTFQVIADHHATGLKNFIPPFEKLYISMPPEQQKRADRLFVEHHRAAGF